MEGGKERPWKPESCFLTGKGGGNPGWDGKVVIVQTLENTEALIFEDYRSQAVVLLKSPGTILNNTALGDFNGQPWSRTTG